MVRNHCIGLPSFQNGLLACCAVTHPALRAQQPQGIGYASIYGWLHTCFGSTCVCVWAAASAWCVQPLISVCVGCVPSLGAACKRATGRAAPTRRAWAPPSRTCPEAFPRTCPATRLPTEGCSPGGTCKPLLLAPSVAAAGVC
jgi:hypothetical protein